MLTPNEEMKMLDILRESVDKVDAGVLFFQ